MLMAIFFSFVIVSLIVLCFGSAFERVIHALAERKTEN